MTCRTWSEVKGPADFSGYWRVTKTENFDVFLQDLGLPWVVRKAAVKFAGSAIDVISHAGNVMKVTSLNAKSSWSRTYDTEKEVMQRNAEGVMCKTVSWWEGRVFHSRLEGSPLGVCESLRYVKSGIMVVKTTVKLASGDSSMYWYFEMMEVLHRHLGGQGRWHLLRRIERDQRQVDKATRVDNSYLQRLLQDWDRWKSPADEFIHVVSPSYSRMRLKMLSHAGSPHVSQGNLSKSPSASSLGSPLDMRSEGRSGRSDVGSRSRLCSESTSALDKASIADLAKADKMVAAAAAAVVPPPQGSQPLGGTLKPAGAATSDSGDGGSFNGPSSPTAPAAAQPARSARAPHFSREISLTIRQCDVPGPEFNPDDSVAAVPEGGAEAPAEQKADGYTYDAAVAAGPTPALPPVRPRPSPPGDATGNVASVTFQLGEGLPDSPTGLRFGSDTVTRITPSSGSAGVGGLGPSTASEVAVAASDLATMGSGSGGDGVETAGHVRVASTGSLSAVAAGGGSRMVHHRKNLSGEGLSSDGRPSLRPTPRSTPTHRQLPTNGEQLMAFKAHEYLDGRGIAAVVPVATPNDTSEPQLLCMSPEQAEQTHAKLRELEEEMLLQRQEYRKGITCCGCFVVSWVSSSLPDHLRTWEMSVS